MSEHPKKSTDPTDLKVRSILTWLATHRESSETELEGLREQLKTLSETPLPPTQALKLLEMLYASFGATLNVQVGSFAETVLPIHRRLRQQVKNLQDVLESFALAYEGVATAIPLERYPSESPLPVSRAIFCLNRHLFISHLVAAPPGLGIWQRLHGIIQASREKFAILEQNLPPQLQQIYGEALLLACAQPASFSSRELTFIAEYARRWASLLELCGTAPADTAGVFWVDSSRDISSFALSRRPPPPEFQVFYFSCSQVARQAEADLLALIDGASVESLKLPVFAGTPAGKGTLRRLVSFWGKPGKRHFPRRRQSHRATLCSGLGTLWRLLQTPEKVSDEDFSHWMITNESPDGYALMHLSGKVGRLHIGDIVAIQPKAEAEELGRWQISLVRWAISENPEHIEIGLQVLAPEATPALLAVPSDPLNKARTSALVLPELPPLRTTPILVVPAGAISDQNRKLLLLIEKDNLEIRQVRATEINEQTGRVEVFSIEPDASE